MAEQSNYKNMAVFYYIQGRKLWLRPFKRTAGPSLQPAYHLQSPENFCSRRNPTTICRSRFF
jgi:hypothetical protein